MAHEHDVIDKDTHFIIDPETMAISCAGEVKALKRGDHRSERYTFEMPRYIEGHDMSLCNKVEVHYNNLHYDSSTRETNTNSSFDDVQGFAISAADEDTVVWTWLVSGDATQLDGTLNFCVRFACMNGEEIEYQKFTEVYESIEVGASIFNTNKVAVANVDVLEAWRNEIIAQIPDQLSDLENDLYYSNKRSLFLSLTKDDFTPMYTTDDAGNSSIDFYTYTASPKLEWLASVADLGYTMTASGGNDSVTCTESDVEVYENSPGEYGIMDICILLNGSDLTGQEVDAFTLIVAPFLDDFCVELYRLESKKIPFDCIETEAVEAEIVSEINALTDEVNAL